MKTAFLVLVALGVAVTAAYFLYARFGPVSAERWHVDPLIAPDPGPAGVRLLPPEAPVFAMPPEDLMAALDRTILASPRTRRIAGSVAEGHATYLKRTRWLGFPDTTTVRVLPAGDGATVAVLSRARLAGYDWGVNAARVERWLAAVRTP